MRLGCLRPSTINAVGTERDTWRSGETDTVTAEFGRPASGNEARKRASARRGRSMPTPTPRNAPQQAAKDGDLTGLDMYATLELQVDLK